MTTFHYRDYRIEKRDAWHSGETLGYRIFSAPDIHYVYFDSLQEAQEFIRNKTKVVVVGGE